MPFTSVTSRPPNGPAPGELPPLGPAPPPVELVKVVPALAEPDVGVAPSPVLRSASDLAPGVRLPPPAATPHGWGHPGESSPGDVAGQSPRTGVRHTEAWVRDPSLVDR
jgi:hypothetical protein